VRAAVRQQRPTPAARGPDSVAVVRLAMLCLLAACATNRFAVEHVWGGVHGAVADPWYVEDPASAQLAPDGRSAVLVGSGHVVLVASPSGQRIAELPAPVWEHGVAYSADGERFVVVDASRGCAAVWSVRPARELSCIAANAYASVALSPDGGALAVLDAHTLSRWSVASTRQAWSVKVSTELSFDRFAWPVSDLILLGSGSLRARDAATGAQRWVRPDAGRYLGVSGGDAVVLGGFYDAPGSGPVARIDLTTGALRDRSGGDVDFDSMRGGAVLADGTAIVIDRNSVAHRIRLGGGEVGAQIFPNDTGDLSAQRDGRFALVQSRWGVVPWDLIAGTPAALDGARILGLDVAERGIVTITEHGSVVARDHRGHVTARGQMQAPLCRAAAVSAAARVASCAAELYGRDSLFTALRTHEWLALVGGRRGAVDLQLGDALAIARDGEIWAASQGQATWLDPRTGGAVATHPIDGIPRTARVLGKGQAVAYGGWSHSLLPPDAREVERWAAYGLHVVTRDGRATTLDPHLAVVALDSDRAGDSLAVVTFGDLELWRSAGGSWTRRWSAKVEHPRIRTSLLDSTIPVTAVAISDDGSRIAAADNNGRAIALFDSATGIRIASVAVGGPDTRTITALAFGSGRLYAGTSTGLVLVLSLPRR
jgi:DNA-binding beta-propeller fold protein YncE